jgi:hypothetical protein
MRIINDGSAQGDGNRRIGRCELGRILERTGERDRAVLQALHDYRYLLTGQVQRLYFRQATSRLAAIRATNRALLKLQTWGLAFTLKRRIGGVRAGSGSYVWVLSPVGHRLLELLNRPDSSKAGSAAVRKRSHEPSPAFLQHTLATAEVSVRLTEMTARREIGLTERQLEPECWRGFTNSGGTLSALRPDLYAVTVADGGRAEYEDHWFIEVDLATESPAVVVRKCRQYLAYMRSGVEQAKSGVFPLVVWVVPDVRRKASLAAHMAEGLAAELSDRRSPFVTITLEELHDLVANGLETR